MDHALDHSPDRYPIRDPALNAHLSNSRFQWRCRFDSEPGHNASRFQFWSLNVLALNILRHCGVWYWIDCTDLLKLTWSFLLSLATTAWPWIQLPLLTTLRAWSRCERQPTTALPYSIIVDYHKRIFTLCELRFKCKQNGNISIRSRRNAISHTTWGLDAAAGGAPRPRADIPHQTLTIHYHLQFHRPAAPKRWPPCEKAGRAQKLGPSSVPGVFRAPYKLTGALIVRRPRAHRKFLPTSVTFSHLHRVELFRRRCVSACASLPLGACVAGRVCGFPIGACRRSGLFDLITKRKGNDEKNKQRNWNY
ncbi:hypothetical protein EVAR_41424_1 [Eumeta japonica]|uniref:Uncharacterized protein n=1 Tax=Eumeta variegata TaxID=151549 RepID=A0A4C1W4T5_EUMVA|nr:hypothetical protein EVAR_41424_1 [Eumeta japonica]